MADWSSINSVPSSYHTSTPQPVLAYGNGSGVMHAEYDDDALGILEDMPMRTVGATTKPSYSSDIDTTPLQEQECRNCHEPGGDDLIAPCPCSGSVKWVHRSCLDEWRAVSPNPMSFDHCDICTTPYEMEFVGDKQTGCPRLLFAFLITRDFLLFAVVVNALATLCSVMVWGFDQDRLRDELFDKIHWSNAPHLVIDWFFGWVFFFFIVGIIGMLLGLGAMCGVCCTSSKKSPTYDTYNYGGGMWFCYCPGPYYDYGGHNSGCCAPCLCGDCASCCDCGSCNDCGNCNCGKIDGEGAIVALIVVVVLIVAIGIIVGLVAAVLMGMRIVRNHIHVLEYRYKTGQWRVKDLSRTDLHSV